MDIQPTMQIAITLFHFGHTLCETLKKTRRRSTDQTQISVSAWRLFKNSSALVFIGGKVKQANICQTNK